MTSQGHLEIQLYPMVYEDEDNATLWTDESKWLEPDYFAVDVLLVDPATGAIDLIEEYDDLNDYAEAQKIAEEMCKKYPAAQFEDLYRPDPLVSF